MRLCGPCGRVGPHGNALAPRAQGASDHGSIAAGAPRGRTFRPLPMPHLLPYFQVSPDPAVWLMQLLAIVLVSAAVDAVLQRLLAGAAHAADRHRSVWDDALLQAARLPARLLVWGLGLSAALRLWQAVQPSRLFDAVPDAQRLAVIGIAALLAMRFIRHAEVNLADPARSAKAVDAATARSIGKLLRLCVAIAAALMAMQTLGISVSGLMAMGGVGGIAIGFAAKDLLANFFGGLMIYWDKPFREGDWIRSPDHAIEGTVEDIGWRLTRIRTFEMRPIYVPNALFNNIVVENASRMTHWRISTELGIDYRDAAKLPAICEDLRQMLQTHPGIDAQQTLIVRFNQMADSSLNILLYCFTDTTDWGEYLRVQEDVYLKVMDTVARHGAELPFPTQTVYLPDLAARQAAAAAGAASA